MSTMLEQAIIDAAALRETALKSAEATLIEKYKQEFEDTVEKLLEQEEVEPPDQEGQSQPEEMSPETAAANAEDPTAPTITDQPDPTANLAGGMTQPQSKAFEKVKSAFFDLDGADDELITINFDGLKSKPAESSDSMMLNTPDMSAPPMMENVDLDEELELELERYDAGHNWDSMLDEERDDESGQTEDELEEEIELDEEALEETAASISPVSPSLRQDAARDKQKAAEKETKAAILDAEETKKAAEDSKKSSGEEQELTEEEVELTEEEMDELEEALRVDMHNESEGYMGSHKRKEREFKSVAFAAARDTKKSEEREEKEKALADLQESTKKINSLKSRNKELSETNEKLLQIISNLKENIQQINVSNAKLLYTNKALSDDSLNERQKNTVVENIARASSVTEAKTIYETLQSTVQSIKEEKMPKSLSEAIGRSKTPFLSRKGPANLNESLSDRMKILAGIKNFN